MEEIKMKVTVKECNGGLNKADVTFDSDNDVTSETSHENSQEYITLDGNIVKVSTDIASLYSDTSTYSAGALCIYDYKLWKCINAVAIPEPFNSSKWQLVTIEELLENISTDKIKYSIVAPTQDNVDGLVSIVILDTEPSNYYNGYLYIIKGE